MQLHTADLDWITPEAEKVIARHARVSTKDPDREEYENLLTYCIKHAHWSVLEQASASFEISTTRAISPQILRHRSFVFQEACITGDSLISFELPHGHTKNKRSHYTRSISYLYDRFHFGAAPINSRWDSENKRRIPLKDRIQNMRIRVFDQNTNEFITSNIVDIYKTGVKPCYEIKFSNGKKIKSTLDHKFLTKSGFAPLKEILDLRVTSNNTVAIPIERADILFATNGVPVYSHPDKAYDLSNIEVLCKECHSRTHGTEGHRVEWRHRSSGNKLTARWTTVESITYLGLLDTYDLEVDHDSHNYVANGVVVHNSQRYCNPNETLDIEEKPFQFELRFQAQKNRQSSVDRLPVYMCESFWDRLEIVDSQIQGLYNEMLEAGVARECARNILPLYTPTRMHMSGTVRSFIHYVGLRGKEDTQKEHRQIARSIGYRLARELPDIIKAVKDSKDSSLKGWDFIRYAPN